MNPRGRWSRGLAPLVAAVATSMVLATLPAGAVRADVAFRKKKAPSTDSSGTEAAPSGGEIENAPTEGGGETPAPPPKTEFVPQAEDVDRPRDRDLEKQQADALLQMKQHEAAEKNKPPPIYTKWQFWALVGGGLVVLGGVIFGGVKLGHEINGGDVRACNPDLTSCFGAGH